MGWDLLATLRAVPRPVPTENRGREWSAASPGGPGGTIHPLQGDF